MYVEGALLSVTPMVVFLVREQSISIIGAGSLGTGVINALYSNGHRKIIATRRNEEELKSLAQKYSGIETTTDNKLAAEKSDVVILTVKPKLIEEVGLEISQYAQDKLVVSLAAGKSISYLESFFSESRVARAMTGVFVEDEVAAYSLGKDCAAEDYSVIEYIFGTNAIEVEEEHLTGRTFIACDTGIMAREVAEKAKALIDYGMDVRNVASFYAGTLRALATGLEAGMSGEQMYFEVAGKDSFTGKLYRSLLEDGHFKLLKKAVDKTIKKLK